MQIMQQRSLAYTMHDAKNKPLLNIDDRKLSGSFSCVVPGIFWGGLQALCLGIALAALALATIATGGLALAVICAVGLTACAVGIGAGVTALCQIAHACDATLSSEWLYSHENVKIENANALLNRSQLICTKGGVLNLIINSDIAEDAAMKISDHNLNQFYAQIGSQFAMGLIGGIFSGGGTGFVISSIIALPGYFWGEGSINTPVDEDAEEYGGPVSGAVGGVVTNTYQSIVLDYAGKVIEHSVEEAAQEQGARAVLGEFVEELWETGVTDFSRGLKGRNILTAVIDDFAGFKAAITGKGPLSGGFNIGSFLVNLGIAIGSDMYEENQEQMAISVSRSADDNDSGNVISVVAVEV